MAKVMNNCIQNSMPKIFNSLFAPVSAIHTRTPRLASSSNKFYFLRYRTSKIQKVLIYKRLKFETQYLMKLKKFRLINLK